MAWLNDDLELLRFPTNFIPEPDTVYALGVTNDKTKDKPEYWVRFHLVPYGDFCLFPRALGQRFGWWSDRYRFFYSDVEFILKFWRHANGLRNLEGSLVYHTAHEDALKRKIKKLLAEDGKIFYDTWGPMAKVLEEEVRKKQCSKRN